MPVPGRLIITLRANLPQPETLPGNVIGSSVRIFAEITDETGASIDVEGCRFLVRRPSDRVPMLRSDVLRLGLGLYAIDQLLDDAGAWRVRFEATGPRAAAGEAHFAVPSSTVLAPRQPYPVLRDAETGEVLLTEDGGPLVATATSALPPAAQLDDLDTFLVVAAGATRILTFASLAQQLRQLLGSEGGDMPVPAEGLVYSDGTQLARAALAGGLVYDGGILRLQQVELGQLEQVPGQTLLGNPNLLQGRPEPLTVGQIRAMLGLGASGADANTVLNGAAAPSGATGANGDFYIRTSDWTLYGPKAGGAWPNPVSLVGPAGSNGANGANGRTVLSGSAAPTSAAGIDGDFYIRTSDWTIYGPKASGAWPGPVSLVGPAGAGGGSAGNGVLSGSAAPTGAVGIDGDFYIRTANWTLYGPKAGGTWPAPVSLIGPAGSNGADGADGTKLLSGSGAPSNALGIDGDFYIRTANWTLYGPKAGGIWPGAVSLIGPPGANGMDGKTVLSGSAAPTSAVGVDGDFYIRTANWTIYGPKASGTWPSPASLVGGAGPNGADGKTVLSGSTAPSSAVGVDGDFYIRTSDWTIYGPKAGGVWPGPVSLVGPAGPAGTGGGSGGGGGTVTSVAVDTATGLRTSNAGNGAITNSGTLSLDLSVIATRSWVNDQGFLTVAPVISVAGLAGAISAANLRTALALSTVASTGAYADLTGKPTIPPAYVLPPATATVLGGIKPGAGLAVAADGTLNATGYPKQLDKGTATAGSTQTFDLSQAVCQTLTVGGACSVALTGWPTAAGALAELIIEMINGGSAYVTWPTSIRWIKTDGTWTNDFNQAGVFLQLSGTDWVFLWSRDGGATIWGKVLR